MKANGTNNGDFLLHMFISASVLSSRVIFHSPYSIRKECAKLCDDAYTLEYCLHGMNPSMLL